MRKPFKLSHLTTAAALFAGLFVGSQFADLAGPAAAHAAPQSAEQPDSDGGTPFNSTAQRKQMITQLTEMNQRLTRIESKLASGISVKVTEMPAVTVKESADKN